MTSWLERVKHEWRMSEGAPREPGIWSVRVKTSVPLPLSAQP